MQTEHFAERPDDTAPNTTEPENQKRLQDALFMYAMMAAGRSGLQEVANDAHKALRVAREAARAAEEHRFKIEDELREATGRQHEAGKFVADLLRDTMNTSADLGQVLDIWYGSYRSLQYTDDMQQGHDAMRLDAKDRSAVERIEPGVPFIDLNSPIRLSMGGVVTSLPGVEVKDSIHTGLDLEVAFTAQRFSEIVIEFENQDDRYQDIELYEDEEPENGSVTDVETIADRDERTRIGLTGLSGRMIVGQEMIHELLENYTPSEVSVNDGHYTRAAVHLHDAHLTIRLLDAIDTLDLYAENADAVAAMTASLVDNTRKLLDIGDGIDTEFIGFPNPKYASIFLSAVKKFDTEAYQTFLDTLATSVVNQPRQDLTDEVVDFLCAIELEKQYSQVRYTDRKDMLVHLKGRAAQLSGAA